jgi:hypothetical protein
LRCGNDDAELPEDGRTPAGRKRRSGYGGKAPRQHEEPTVKRNRRRKRRKGPKTSAANGRWRAQWTDGTCNACGNHKRVFATHGALHSTYAHICADCYRRYRQEKKSPDLPWGYDPNIERGGHGHEIAAHSG